MMKRKIMLKPDEVKDFVVAASKCDFDIDIAYNRYAVDAKSIVGVFGLDFSQILTVYVETGSCLSIFQTCCMERV